MKRQGKNKNIIQSFRNAANGILYAAKNERNMKVHLAAAGAVAILSFFYRLSREEVILICLTVAFVIVCELFNTALEILVDVLFDVYHPKAKAIKDLSAGAVTISAAASLIVGYIVFFDKVSSSLEKGIVSLRQFPAHITILAGIVTVILVIAVKVLMRRGIPSVHTAVAFSITTATALWTGHAGITLLFLSISLLVALSCLEGKTRSLIELTAGAVVGFLITLAVYQMLYSYKL